MLSVSCLLIAMNGLQSYVLDNLTHDSEGIELVCMAYADDIAVPVSSDLKNGRGMLVIRKVVELVDRWLEENGFQMSKTDENTTLLQKTPLSEPRYPLAWYCNSSGQQC
jgi:hypothetical protein